MTFDEWLELAAPNVVAREENEFPAPLVGAAVIALADKDPDGKAGSGKIIDFKSLRVLIVDDSRTARSVIKDSLSKIGVRDTLEAEDGAEGLAMVKWHPIDLVLLDQEMPLMNGIEFVMAVRRLADKQLAEIPVIMISNYAQPANIAAAKEAGVHEFIAKPFSAQSLYIQIRETLTNRREFIRSNTYIGPDRRWLDIDPLPGPERRRGTG